MAGGTVGWHFFDVESGLVPDESNPSILPGEGRGRIVVLAATPFAMTDGWAARAAAEIAKSWSVAGLQVVLMDLGLENPSLHEVLNLPNEEGVSDAFLFGASIRHIARPAMDEAFFFAPAGSAPGDPEEVLGHPRWNDLAGGFSEADATLLLFLPSGIPGAAKILSRATDVLFLAAQGESPDRHLGPASIKLVANIGPVGSPPEEGLEDAEPEDGPEKEVISSLGADPFGEPAAVMEETEKTPEDSGLNSSFDFGEEFELAEGFGEQDIPEAEEESTELPAVEEIPGVEALEGEEEPGLSLAGDLDPGEEPEPQVSQGFGDDLTMGASLVGDGEEETKGVVPDFGAEFVDLGGEEDLESGGGFGEDLVQGADFGAPAPGGELEEVPPEPAAGEEAFSAEDAATATVPEAPKEAPKRRRPPRKSFPWGRVAVTVLLVGIMGAALGTATGFLDVPGFTFLRDYFGEIPDPPLTLAGPQPNEEVLRYSLVLDIYDEGELEVATEMLGILRTRLPELLFVLAPGEEEGQRIYTLMAGPAYDRLEAENLRGPLADVLIREDPDSWAIRETPRGFYLGERETFPEAQEYLESFSAEGVYPYILHVTYPDGTEAFEILAGAYDGVPEARPLQMILRETGFRDLPLIERRGRLPE